MFCNFFSLLEDISFSLKILMQSFDQVIKSERRGEEREEKEERERERKRQRERERKISVTINNP